MGNLFFFSRDRPDKPDGKISFFVNVARNGTNHSPLCKAPLALKGDPPEGLPKAQTSESLPRNGERGVRMKSQKKGLDGRVKLG